MLTKEQFQSQSIESTLLLVNLAPTLSIFGLNLKFESHTKYTSVYVGGRGAKYTIVTNRNIGLVVEDPKAPNYSIVSQRGKMLGVFCISDNKIVECEQLLK